MENEKKNKIIQNYNKILNISLDTINECIDYLEKNQI